MSPAYEPWAEPIESLNLKKQDLNLYTEEEKQKLFYYRNKNNEYLPYFKEDIEKEIDVFKPNTFLPILKELDFPFYERRWLEYIKLCMKKGWSFSTVLRKYLAWCRLFDIKTRTFKDSNRFFMDGYDYNSFQYIPKIKFELSYGEDI